MKKLLLYGKINQFNFPKVFLWLSMLLVAAVSFYIFLQQACTPFGGSFPSDLPSHIAFAKQIYFNGLIIPHPLFHFSIIITKSVFFINFESASALLLALANAWSFYLFFKICQKISSQITAKYVHIVSAWIMFFVSSIILPFYIENKYLGQGTPSIWHNPTFVFSKPLVLIAFFGFVESLKLQEFHWKNIKLYVYAVLLCLAAWIKPNASITLMITLALLIIFTKNWKIKTLIIAFFLVLPTIFSLLIQYYIAYKLCTLTESKIIIDFIGLWSHYSPNIVVSLLLAILFPLMISVFRFDVVRKNIYFLAAFVFFIFSLLQMMLFAETGSRYYDWNFSWSYNVALIFIFMVSIAQWIMWLHELKSTPRLISVRFIVVSLFLLLHLISGIYYFCEIFKGNHYI